jgi:hypothetical protein
VAVEQLDELGGTVARDVVQGPAGLAVERPGSDLGVGTDDLEVDAGWHLGRSYLLGWSGTGPQPEVAAVHEYQLAGRAGDLAQQYALRHERAV